MLTLVGIFYLYLVFMKKCCFIILLVMMPLSLISWGVTGHRTVGKIAENHLSPEAKEAIKKLIGNESLADISNWADDIRADAAYRYTGAWHYVNVPAGLTFEQFSATVKHMPEDNVYKAVLQYKMILENPKKSRSERTIALKYLVHLIGDLHQPMHVSHAEDKGGNAIAVTFINDNDNLHGLWDSGLIDHQHLSYKQMAETYDTATPLEIEKWQSDDLMVWLWESYQISTILYQEAADNPRFGEEYYQEHLPVLQKRIEKAGIRLAGVLNAVLTGAPEKIK